MFLGSGDLLKTGYLRAQLGSTLRFIGGSALLVALLACSPASAITGGGPAPPAISGGSSLIVSTRGAACSSAVLTQSILLTAAHCVGPKSDYAAVVFEDAGPKLIPIARIVLHPRYNASDFEDRKPTPDVAVVTLAESLPASFRPVRLSRDIFQPRAGDRFLLAGYGIRNDADPKSAGKLFSVELPVIGNTVDASGTIMVRLSAGADKVIGACDGDSGGPIYRGEEVAAIIGWRKATGGRHCGTVTGATLVAPQLDWILNTAERLGGRLAD